MEFPRDVHPYRKWWGTHWRLVELADLGAPREPCAPGIEDELAWVTTKRVRTVRGLVRNCASQEGNAVYACAKLGYADDPRVHGLADSLLEWQWPDGGWNCDVNASGYRSSFHETVTPAIGLAAFARATGDADAERGARRAAELLLEHGLFRRLRDGGVIHPSFVKIHYPAYWHYDVLQGLRLLDALGMLSNPRAQDALDLVAGARRKDGRFSGPSWTTKTMRDAVEWGRGPDNDMLNTLARHVLEP